MTRRGDGVGIEVLPDELRGVRLQLEAAGRVAAVATVACDADDDLSLLDGLGRLRTALAYDGQPARACMWSRGCHIQSLDVTGRSTNELNVHRAALVDVSATLEMAAGPRRLLAHLRCDIVHHRRVEHLLRQAGFELEGLEPTPVAIARLLPDATWRVVTRRGGEEPWVAVVHDRTVVAAVPRPAAAGKRSATLGDLQGAPWLAPIDALRERLVDPAELERQLEEPTAAPVALVLDLVGDPYPDFPPADPAFGPHVAAALGAAVAAAGLAGRLYPVQALGHHAFDVDSAVWVVERVGDLATRDPALPRRRWWR